MRYITGQIRETQLKHRFFILQPLRAYKEKDYYGVVGVNLFEEVIHTFFDSQICPDKEPCQSQIFCTKESI